MSAEVGVLKVASPLSGWCASLDDSPDPVFRDRMLGDGVSIDPTVGELRAPFDGEILTVPASRHAINLRAANGAEFLIHVGIDTVRLGGEGFEAHVEAGAQVRAGQLLLTFDLDRLARKAPSLRSPVLLLTSERHVLQRARAEGMVQTGDVIFEVACLAPDLESGAGKGADRPGRGGEIASRSVAIGLAHGIHARPAAGLIEAIRNLDAAVTVEFQGRTADLRSAVALMGLNTCRGARVCVTARGPDAERALDAVVARLEPLAVEEAAAVASAEAVDSNDCEPIRPPADGSVLRGLTANPGLGRGQAVRLGRDEADPRKPAAGADEERAALEAARLAVRSTLQHQAAAGDGVASEIAGAHLALLDDPMVTNRAQELLDRGLAAGRAWQQSVEVAVQVLLRLDEPRMRERADDLRDIDLRVQRALAGHDPLPEVELPQGAVILSDNLLPSQLLELDRGRLAGICLAAGGTTSHVAILAGSLGIPMLVAAGKDVLGIEAGSELLVDADLGELHVRPGRASAERFAARIEQERQAIEAHANEAQRPCMTVDGERIHVHANIGSAADARAAVAAGAEGCGLLRTEFLFMRRERAPAVDEQLAAFREIGAALGDRPLTIRTLDAGADKPIPYLQQVREENPALGVRGIRLGLAHPEILEAQLRALLQLEHPQPVRVMIPMVSAIHEVEAVRDRLLKLAGGDKPGTLQLGVMIETPAAALIAEHLAEIVDFFSIGTNDLAQYTLSMDRAEARLAGELDALHPAVLRLIQRAAAAAREADIPVAVCGAAACDLLAAPLLLGLGVRELSMPAGHVARQKARLRALSAARCEEIAARCLQLGSAGAVRGLMREFLKI